jgi:ABC-type transport system involved in multi-copper enzyme maturation permease subunit
MNRGLVMKALREVAITVLLCGVALAAFEALLAYVFWTYQKELTEDLMQVEFIRNLIKSLVGGKFEGQLGPESLRSLAWVHPLVLALVFAHGITTGSRVPAGEVDRGTADIMFTWPVSREAIFAVEFAVCFATGAFVLALGLLGSLVGHQFVPAEVRPDPERVAIVVFNLYLLAMTVAGITFLLSTLTDRRGRAVGWAFGIVLTCLLWNFLAQYWKPAEQGLFLNLLYYYQPLPILTQGIFPARNYAVLSVCCAAAWGAGLLILRRRDICTT